MAKDKIITPTTDDPKWSWKLQAAIEYWRGEADNGVMDPGKREYLYTLLAALDGREAGWLPIETAPRDGRHVLLIAPWWGPPEPLIGRYDVSIAGYSWRDARSGSVCEPTHWRPLPAPPARPQPAEGG